MKNIEPKDFVSWDVLKEKLPIPILVHSSMNAEQLDKLANLIAKDLIVEMYNQITNQNNTK